MINLIKKILKEEFNDKREEKFYQLFKKYMNKTYETFMSTKWDEYSANVIMVYRLTPTDPKYRYADYSFDIRKDGTLFNSPATMDLSEKFGLSLKELGKFLTRYIKEIEK